MSYFDKLYDLITFMLIVVCYVGSAWMILRLMMGSDTLMDAVVLAMLGTGLSAVFIWIRSRNVERQHIE